MTNHPNRSRRAQHQTVSEVLADPKTPAWITEGVARLRRNDPALAAFLEAMHDHRVAQRRADDESAAIT